MRQCALAAASTFTFLVLGGLVACATRSHADVVPPPPAEVQGSAYEMAAVMTLPAARATEGPGLHHVFRLSQRIVSGSEPQGEAAFAALARMGVKTLISVDGQAPNQATAGRHGLRYVHIPIQYKGVTRDEVAKLAKTFRETDGPFYVHCFHGQHRGPAAAAIGRIVLDGVARELAAAEMRQWCGTASTYEGLYRSILTQDMPSAAETAKLAYDFPAQAGFTGFRQAMVQVARARDHVQDLLETPDLIDPRHPDLDAVNECRKLVQALEGTLQFSEVKDGAAEMREWMSEAVERSHALLASLEKASGGEAAARAAAAAEFAHVKNSCAQCHKVYRN